jgi:hypothetical protein
VARAPPEPSASESGRISLVVVVEVPPLRTRVFGEMPTSVWGGGADSPIPVVPSCPRVTIDVIDTRG